MNILNNNHPVRKAPSDNRQPQPQNSGINISYNTICLVICFVMLIVNFKVFSMIITSNDSLGSIIYKPEISFEEQKRLDEQAALKKDIQENFTTISVSFEDTKRGDLILINSTNEYSFEAVTTAVSDVDAVTIPDSKDASYWVKSNYDLLKPHVLENLDKLLTDFALETQAKDVMILDTFRTYEDQQRVLNNKIEQMGEEEGRKIATQPGFSEHHTCLATDLTLFDGKKYREYDGAGVYSWITNNCKDYGFIIRYPADKTHLTGINYEPWHLRYVGNAHAYFMMQNNLCLEEYIQLLSGYTIDTQRLTFTDDKGESYSIYSCAIDGEQGTVYVPKNGSYTISGDNNGRIIVTCKISG